MVYSATGMAALLHRLVLRPAMSWWYAAVVRKHASLPRPDDAPVGHTAGPEPLRVLIIGGDGPPVGWGVRSNGLALPGQLARELSARTGRGVDVDLVADSSLTLAGMPAAIAGRDLFDYHVILAMPGVRGAITLVPPSDWRTQVGNLLGLLRASSSAGARLVFVGSEPIRSIPAFDSPLAEISAPHRILLNGISENVCQSIVGASYVALPGSDAVRLGRYRSPDDYQLWAGSLADHVAGLRLVTRLH